MEKYGWTSMWADVYGRDMIFNYSMNFYKLLNSPMFQLFLAMIHLVMWKSMVKMRVTIDEIHRWKLLFQCTKISTIDDWKVLNMPQFIPTLQKGVLAKKFLTWHRVCSRDPGGLTQQKSGFDSTKRWGMSTVALKLLLRYMYNSMYIYI